MTSLCIVYFILPLTQVTYFRLLTKRINRKLVHVVYHLSIRIIKIEKEILHVLSLTKNRNIRNKNQNKSNKIYLFIVNHDMLKMKIEIVMCLLFMFIAFTPETIAEDGLKRLVIINLEFS